MTTDRRPAASGRAERTRTTTDEEGMTYADAGVDVDAEAEAIDALVGATDGFEGEFAGFVDVGDHYLALAMDCVGTKILVAQAVGDFSTIGVDAIAMNANDLVAAGVEPVAFVDYLAVDEPRNEVFRQVGEGLAVGAELADVALLGGETSVMPEVVRGMDMAGTCAGIAGEDDLLPNAAEPGDVLVGVPSNGIHANGLTLARKALTRNHSYDDPLPFDAARTVGEALLEPTRIYAELLDPIHACDADAAAHVTGGGWRNLLRMGDRRYVVDDPPDPHDLFGFIQAEGSVSDAEMYRTFNMGTGFVVAVPPERADELVDAVSDATVVGEVRDGPPGVEIAGLTIEGA